MAYSYPVKWITNTMRGAPVISGTAGALIAALDAFLLTGWGTATAISVSVTGGVGAATFAEGTYFDDHAVVLIAGVTAPAALNGEARVLSHTNNSITFETDAPDGVATTGGSITVKYAPVGQWSKAFSASNIACYRSTDVQSPGHFLRVDDTGTMFARVVGYESMTDVNTGSGPFPTAAIIAGGGYWHKSHAASAAANIYALAADSRCILTAIAGRSAQHPSYLVGNARGFGCPIALASGGDSWGTFLSANGAGVTSGAHSGALSGGLASSSSAFTVQARAFTGLGGAVYVDPTPFTGTAATLSGSDSFMGAAPSLVDGQIKLSRVFLKTAGVPRGVVPGVLYVPQSGLTSYFSVGHILPGAGEFSGRSLLAFCTGLSLDSVAGIAFMDITGPWR